jgi:hypothetical protein
MRVRMGVNSRRYGSMTHRTTLDGAVLTDCIDRERRALNRMDGRSQPLAVSAAARELVERARGLAVVDTDHKS